MVMGKGHNLVLLLPTLTAAASHDYKTEIRTCLLYFKENEPCLTYPMSIFKSHYWQRKISILVISKTYFRFLHFIFHFNISVKHCQLHFSRFVLFGPTLVWTFLSGRQIFNNHWVDLYAEFVRSICRVLSSILRETRNELDHSNFNVLYSSGYCWDILLGENWLFCASNAFFKVTQQCDLLNLCFLMSPPSLNVCRLLFFQHAALSGYEGNFSIYHFEEIAASIKRRQQGRRLLHNSSFRLLYAF